MFIIEYESYVTRALHICSCITKGTSTIIYLSFLFCDLTFPQRFFRILIVLESTSTFFTKLAVYKYAERKVTEVIYRPFNGPHLKRKVTSFIYG